MKIISDSIASIIFTAFALIVIGSISSCTPKVIPSETSTNASSQEYLAQGQSIFENSCNKCHDLPNPTDHNAQEWTNILNSMAPKAKLNDAQHRMVYQYVVSVKQ